MTFDITINAGLPDIVVPSEEQLAEGIPPAVEVAVPVAQVLPFSQGPGQPPLTMRSGTVRFGLDRDVAVEFFTKGLEAAQQLPASSRIQVAQSLDGVDQAAVDLRRMQGTDGAPD